MKVVLAKPGLDGHDRGAKVIARALRDAGVEVVYTGLRQTPEQIVATALQEDPDAIGLSVLSGAHTALLRKIRALMAERELDDLPILIGGAIPPKDVAVLRELGAAEVFPTGAALDDVVAAFLKYERVRRTG
ncbi:MAG: cobalamin B12-binding domain-containing protein [Candidatus Eremiobacteraeota bacterium]|nr:cobalamin B12-binding domain-containing protein [Candidatus Eremiobacteraeota bacterium]